MDIKLESKQLSSVEKKIIYVYHTKPLFQEKALFTDETCYYRKPAEPKAGDMVTFRFRTATGNVDKVLLHIGARIVEMEVKEQDSLFDYYEGIARIGEESVSYYFEVQKEGGSCYYDKRGVVWKLEDYYHFKITPGFSTPAWAKGAIFYQIFVERFYNGDPTNDVLENEYVYINECTKKVKDWEKYPATMGVREFYGGDLQGVMDKLDYLKDLGVDVIYFNPLFVSPSNHKYDIQDYDYIDPHFGVILEDKGEVLSPDAKNNEKATRFISRVTNKKNLEASNKLFIKLVEEAHKRGIRVILDGVFNHCGSFNKWLDKEKIYEGQPGYEKGAYIDVASPYHTFFRFYDGDAWPYNSSYDGWWGHDTLPKLNYEDSPKLFEYIMNIAKKWVSPPYNADGWRLDVAADLGRTAEYNHSFWREFRKVVKEANPEALILAEHYGDPGDWLKGDQWDTVMNYDAFMEPITWFLTGMEKHSDEYRGELLGNSDSFFSAMRHHMSRFHQSSLEVAMNELSNHDHSRFLTRTNHTVGRTNNLGPEAADKGVDKGILREAVLMQMTWPGAPTIYYGDEAGMCGWTDPDNRRTYPWGHEDKRLIQYHKDLIQIHKKSEALMHGSIKFLGGGYKTLYYGRFTDTEKIIVIVNNNYESMKIEVPVWEIGVPDGVRMKQLILTIEEDYSTDDNAYLVKDGKIKVVMPKISATILRYIVPSQEKCRDKKEENEDPKDQEECIEKIENR